MVCLISPSFQALDVVLLLALLTDEHGAGAKILLEVM